MIPAAAEALLHEAFERSRPRLARLLPALTGCRPWVYVEYGPGQHITPHVDGIAPDPTEWPRQLAGIGVIVERADDGGEFFVETTSDDRLWADLGTSPAVGYEAEMSFARDGADLSSTWFAGMARTRWTTATPPGTALIYGSQLTHGTLPVRRGTSRKFISWLVAEAP